MLAKYWDFQISENEFCLIFDHPIFPNHYCFLLPSRFFGLGSRTSYWILKENIGE